MDALVNSIALSLLMVAGLVLAYSCSVQTYPRVVPRTDFTVVCRGEGQPNREMVMLAAKACSPSIAYLSMQGRDRAYVECD